MVKLRNWLAGLLRSVGRLIDRLAARMVPSTPSESPGSKQGSPSKDATPRGDAPQAGRQPPYWRQAIDTISLRTRWLVFDRPWIVAQALAIVVLVYFVEQPLLAAWQRLLGMIDAQWTSLRTGHPFTLWVAAVALACLAFLIGFRLLVHFICWAWKRVQAHKILTGVILLFLLWLLNSAGRWVVLPFEVGQIPGLELDGRKAAVQLTAELGEIGTGSPTPAFIAYGPLEPYTRTGSVLARTSLSLDDCDAVLLGPGEFVPRTRIPLPRVVTGSTTDVLTLGNLSVGTVNLPSDLVVRAILRVFPTGFREFSGAITESAGDLQIAVNLRTPSRSWSVSGPSDALDEMIEFLALRIALDLNPEVIVASGMASPPEDGDLAYYMGIAEYRSENHMRARSFLRIADRFVPLRADVDALLGLAEYHLASTEEDSSADRRSEAIRALKAALREDPSREASPFRPYLACLYHKAGMATEADLELRTFNSYLRALEFCDVEVRTEAIRQLPFHGPGRHIAADAQEAAFVDSGGRVVGASGGMVRGLEYGPPGGIPRQVLLTVLESGEAQVLVVSPDGELKTVYTEDSGATWKDETLVQGPTLRGVQQVMISRSRYGWTNLFLLDRFGTVHWRRLDLSVRTCSPSLLRTTRQAHVRQVFPLGDVLYFVAGDGAVLRAEVNELGRADDSDLLTQPAPVHEIFVAGDETLYLLHDNGNLWRYRDDGIPETVDLKLVDEGAGTIQISVSDDSVYLLKGDGAIWRISNARDPAQKVLSKLWEPGERTIQEISVLEDPPGVRLIYLLTAQGELLVGTDTGALTVQFAAVEVSPATQATQSAGG
jgi:hypothetical protein